VGDEKAVQVRTGQQRLVVQHLLEVGDEPEVVDGVAVEASTDLIVHAARGHGVECDRRRGKRVG